MALAGRVVAGRPGLRGRREERNKLARQAAAQRGADCGRERQVHHEADTHHKRIPELPLLAFQASWVRQRHGLFMIGTPTRPVQFSQKGALEGKAANAVPCGRGQAWRAHSRWCPVLIRRSIDGFRLARCSPKPTIRMTVPLREGTLPGDNSARPFESPCAVRPSSVRFRHGDVAGLSGPPTWEGNAEDCRSSQDWPQATPNLSGAHRTLPPASVGRPAPGPRWLILSPKPALGLQPHSPQPQ